jgi:large subunit ribosomal protein L27
MSKKKAAGGKASQHVSPAGKRLGIKIDDQGKVSPGMVIVRQRGTTIGLGKGVAQGRDHTIYAISKGIVKFGRKLGKKIVSVVSK